MLGPLTVTPPETFRIVPGIFVSVGWRRGREGGGSVKMGSQMTKDVVKNATRDVGAYNCQVASHELDMYHGFQVDVERRDNVGLARQTKEKLSRTLVAMAGRVRGRRSEGQGTAPSSPGMLTMGWAGVKGG